MGSVEPPASSTTGTPAACASCGAGWHVQTTEMRHVLSMGSVEPPACSIAGAPAACIGREADQSRRRSSSVCTLAAHECFCSMCNPAHAHLRHRSPFAAPHREPRLAQQQLSATQQPCLRTCATCVLTSSGISRCSSTAPAEEMAARAASLRAQGAVLAPPWRMMRLSPAYSRQMQCSQARGQQERPGGSVGADMQDGAVVS